MEKKLRTSECHQSTDPDTSSKDTRDTNLQQKPTATSSINRQRSGTKIKFQSTIKSFFSSCEPQPMTSPGSAPKYNMDDDAAGAVSIKSLIGSTNSIEKKEKKEDNVPVLEKERALNRKTNKEMTNNKNRSKGQGINNNTRSRQKKRKFPNHRSSDSTNQQHEDAITSDPLFLTSRDNEDNEYQKKKKTKTGQYSDLIVSTDSSDAERAECSTCHEVMSSPNCVPVLLVCGHVATCESCYEKWNKDKLSKTCPICKETQTNPALLVLNRPFIGAYARLDITYVGGHTHTNLTVTIPCRMMSSGDEIKKNVLSHPDLLNINFPFEYTTVCFETQERRFPLHGNTTLYDIGFKATSHTLSVRENNLPIKHELIQQKLDMLEKSPDSEFKLILRARKLPDLYLLVKKHWTVGNIVLHIRAILRDNNVKTQIELFCGKLIVRFPKLGVDVNSEMTLEELRVGKGTRVVYDLVD